MTRTRGPGATHDQRRADILAAVRRLAAERGIGAVSQVAVASTAGVSPGRVQHYFPTKDAMLAATFDELNAAAAARVVDLVGGGPDAAEPRRVLEVVLTELVPHDEATRAHVQFRQAYTALALGHDAIASRLRAQYDRLHRVELAGRIRRDQATGLVDAGVDPDAAAVGLAARAEGLAYYVLIGVCAPSTARDVVLADVAGLYDDA